jgi:hypothetical protein
MTIKTADQLLDEDIREEFAKHKSIFRTCKQLDVSLDRVKRVIGTPNFHIERKTALYGGRGRPELEQYIAATKHASEPWDNTSAELRQARSRYEAGSHEMCQGRDGDTILLYTIPRAVPEPRPGYFKSGAE